MEEGVGGGRREECDQQQSMQGQQARATHARRCQNGRSQEHQRGSANKGKGEQGSSKKVGCGRASCMGVECVGAPPTHNARCPTPPGRPATYRLPRSERETVVGTGGRAQPAPAACVECAGEGEMEEGVGGKKRGVRSATVGVWPTSVRNPRTAVPERVWSGAPERQREQGKRGAREQ